MWKLLIFGLLAFAAAAAERATFDGYKVYRVFPENKDQVERIRSLEGLSDAYSFWAEASQPGRPADVMVAPNKLPDFLEALKNQGIRHELYISDVQSLIEAESSGKEGVHSAGGFDFNNYHTLEEIYAQLDQLAASYPANVQVVTPGKTYENRTIKGVKVSFKANNPGIFIEGGIHAREWISPATVMYILHQLLTNNNPEVRQLAESHDWYIFPSFNPDGYVYTHTTNRLWRKTRKPYGLTCHGTDPNRNWGYKWMEGGASSFPCSETYAGPKPFSDVETETMSRYINSISDKFYAYVAFHSYSQLLLFPYGHTPEHLENYDDLYTIGQGAVKALQQRYGTAYITGNIAEVLYIATGSSLDWVKGTLHKPVTFLYELRDRGRHGFLLPPDQIIPTGEETLDSLVALFKEAKTKGYPAH